MLEHPGIWREHTGLKYAYCHDQIQLACEFLVDEEMFFHSSRVCVSNLSFKNHILIPGNAASHRTSVQKVKVDLELKLHASALGDIYRGGQMKYQEQSVA